MIIKTQYRLPFISKNKIFGYMESYMFDFMFNFSSIIVFDMIRTMKTFSSCFPPPRFLIVLGNYDFANTFHIMYNEGFQKHNLFFMHLNVSSNTHPLPLQKKKSGGY